jgi:uncharacterized UBP type Zn finger protein
LRWLIGHDPFEFREELIFLNTQLNEQNGIPYAPMKMKTLLLKYMPQFQEARQHDAMEAAVGLLQMLENSVKLTFKKAGLSHRLQN